MNEQALREREAWDALSPEQQQALTARREQERTAAARQQEASHRKAQEHYANREVEIGHLLATLAAAGNPGLQPRVMTGVRRSLLGSRQFPLTVGHAWPCGTLKWRQRESNSITPTQDYPTGVTTDGRLVPMNRLLVDEERPAIKGRNSGIIFGGLQVDEPADSKPVYLDSDMPDPLLRDLVRKTLAGAAGQ